MKNLISLQLFILQSTEISTCNINSININQVPLTKALRRIMFTQMDVVVIMDEIILWLV